MDAGSKVVRSTDGSVRVWDAVGGVWIGPLSEAAANAKARALRSRAAEKKLIAQSSRDAQVAMFSTAAPAAPVSGSYEVRGFSDGWRVYSPRMGAYVVSQNGTPWRSEREAIEAMVDLQRSEAVGPRDADAQLGLFARRNGGRKPRRAAKPVAVLPRRAKPRKGR